MLRIRLKEAHLTEILGKRTNHTAHKELARKHLPDIVQKEKKKAKLLRPSTWTVNPQNLVKEAILDAKAINFGKMYAQR